MKTRSLVHRSTWTGRKVRWKRARTPPQGRSMRSGVRWRTRGSHSGDKRTLLSKKNASCGAKAATRAAVRLRAARPQPPNWSPRRQPLSFDSWFRELFVQPWAALALTANLAPRAFTNACCAHRAEQRSLLQHRSPNALRLALSRARPGCRLARALSGRLAHDHPR